MSEAKYVPAWLHIKSQSRWHGSVIIRGTKAGLVALRDGLNAALDVGTSEASAFASDGEGYGIDIARCRTVSALGKPFYIDEAARDIASYERDQMIRHDKLIRTQNIEAIEALRWCRANGNPHVKDRPL